MNLSPAYEWWETDTKVQCEFLKERDHLEDPDFDWRIILKCILAQKGTEDVDGIHLPQDRDQWRVLSTRYLIFYKIRTIRKEQTIWITKNFVYYTYSQTQLYFTY